MRLWARTLRRHSAVAARRAQSCSWVRMMTTVKHNPEEATPVLDQWQNPDLRNRLPTLNLVDPPVTLPRDSAPTAGGEITGNTARASASRFSVEGRGNIDKDWIARLPQYYAVMRNLAYVPPAGEFWQRPKHEAFKHIANFMSYYDLLRYVNEHGYRFFISDMLTSPDAPMPHLIYEDIMHALTFCSKQDPMEKQFHLDPTILRSLFCLCANYIIMDRDYFAKAAEFFRFVEQQQGLSSELLSSWVMCCVVAGEVDMAITYAKYMEQQQFRFDPMVFSLLMHPHMDIADFLKSGAQAAAKGMIEQQRLSYALQHEWAVPAAVVHAMFVFYSLTLDHKAKWDTIRFAVQNRVAVSDRTAAMAWSVFDQEKGLRCGPMTNGALCELFASRGQVEEVLDVLVRMRQIEQLPTFEEFGIAEFELATKARIKNELQKSCADHPCWNSHYRPAIETLLEQSEIERIPKEQMSALHFPTLKKLLKEAQIHRETGADESTTKSLGGKEEMVELTSGNATRENLTSLTAPSSAAATSAVIPLSKNRTWSQTFALACSPTVRRQLASKDKAGSVAGTQKGSGAVRAKRLDSSSSLPTVEVSTGTISLEPTLSRADYDDRPFVTEGVGAQLTRPFVELSQRQENDSLRGDDIRERIVRTVTTSTSESSLVEATTGAKTHLPNGRSSHPGQALNHDLGRVRLEQLRRDAIWSNPDLL
jgi:hypothetical protein